VSIMVTLQSSGIRSTIRASERSDSRWTEKGARAIRMHMEHVPGKRLTKDESASINATLEKASPQEVLGWALSTFGRGIALAWSGAEDVAVLDMMYRIDPKAARAFVLDTGRLNPETYELIDQVQAKYRIPIEIQFPDATALQKMVSEKGINLFYRSLENRK